jgi:hypothetical protein
MFEIMSEQLRNWARQSAMSIMHRPRHRLVMTIFMARLFDHDARARANPQEQMA